MHFAVAYASSATQQLSRDDLEGILRTCRARNAALGVTGALLYRDGNFMQVLEGDERVVKELYAFIQRDPRHTGFITLLEEDIAERSFEDYTVAFRDLTGSADLAGYSDFMNRSGAGAELGPDPSLSQRWLMIFRAGFAGGCA